MLRAGELICNGKMSRTTERCAQRRRCHGRSCSSVNARGSVSRHVPCTRIRRRQDLDGNPDGVPRIGPAAMSVTLWTAGLIASLLAVVIAALPLRRREQHHTLTVGPISSNWLTEYKARHLRDRS